MVTPTFKALYKYVPISPPTSYYCILVLEDIIPLQIKSSEGVMTKLFPLSILCTLNPVDTYTVSPGPI